MKVHSGSIRGVSCCPRLEAPTHQEARDREQLARVVTDLKAQIHSGAMSDSLSRLVNDKELWVSYLHIVVMTGKGKIDKDTIQHTNLRKYYPAGEGDFRVSRSGSTAAEDNSATASSSDAYATIDPRLLEDVPSPTTPCVPGYDLRSQHTRANQQPSLVEEEERQQEGDSEDVYVPRIIDDGDSDCEDGNDSDDKDDVPSVDNDELFFIGAIQTCHDATPLAVGRIRQRFNNIAHHFAIAKIPFAVQSSRRHSPDHQILGSAKGPVSDRCAQKVLHQ